MTMNFLFKTNPTLRIIRDVLWCILLQHWYELQRTVRSASPSTLLACYIHKLWVSTVGNMVPLNLALEHKLHDRSSTRTRVLTSSRTSTTVNVTSPWFRRYQVFAVAAFDDFDNPIGEGIGKTCAPVETLSPLPLPLCWAHLSRTALGLGHPLLAGQVSR